MKWVREGAQRIAQTSHRDAVFAVPDIDGVIVATPNHWHVLAGYWTREYEEPGRETKA